jgi:site-specific DNA recombinase
MVAMLRFLKKRGREDCVVIFDDLKRFARDTIFHLKLRQELAAYNATVECLNFKFEDTPEGQFVETVIAAQSQLERLQNRRQTLQKMKARVERGYYVFAVPVGYRYEKVGSHGRLLVRSEPLASIVQEALEGYASGRFQLQAEVKRFLETQPAFPKTRSGIVRNQEVTRLLTRLVYAGYVEAPNWGISLRKGHHEPLISFEAFQTIRDRLTGHARAPARKNLDADFPLRGAVVCGHCNTPLTACWAKGKYSLYPYYFCPKRGCEDYAKTVRREIIEGQFETILRQVQPSKEVFAAALPRTTRPSVRWKRTFPRSNVRSISSSTASPIQTRPRSSPPTRTASGRWRNKSSSCQSESRIAAGRYATSTKHLKLRLVFSQALVSSGIRSGWRTSEQC